MIAIFLILTLVDGMYALNYYQTTIFPADKAKEYLNVATSSSNLITIGDTFKKIATMLEYNFNPSLYPTAAMDYTQIKNDLNKAAIDSNAAAMVGGLAYQQAVGNMYDVAQDIYNRLGEANWALGTNPYINTTGYILFIVNLTAPGWLFAIGYGLSEAMYQRRKEAAMHH